MIALLPGHAATLAAIHAEAFPPGERWDMAAFAGLLGMPGACGLLDEAGGFILAREAGGEAEVLTLAVMPVVRRRGVGGRLLTAMLAQLACPVFLEVAADNLAALALYLRVGFSECGRRRSYYGPGRDALVLRRLPVD